MEKINTFEYDIDNKFTIDEFRNLLNAYENEGATHLQLSYQDYGNPMVDLFKEVQKQEKTIPVTYATIRRNIGWSEFAEVTGGNVYAINEGANFEDRHIFWVTSDQAEKLRL